MMINKDFHLPALLNVTFMLDLLAQPPGPCEFYVEDFLMRTIGLFVGIGGLAFVLAGYQAGLFREAAAPGALAEEKKEDKQEEKKLPKARFPQDLAPAARAEAVPRAAAFDTSAKIQHIAILRTDGKLYQDWQEKLKEEWQAESVEETALVIVVGRQNKKFVEIIHYPGGAPPISRYKYEVEASIIEAKTGKVLANRIFVNMPRQIVRIETWDTTALGSPVEFRTVFQWAVAEMRFGLSCRSESHTHRQCRQLVNARSA